MKKVYIIAAAVVVLGIGGIIGSFLLKKDASTPSTGTKTSFTVYEACTLLTKDKAAQLLGTTATLGQEPSPSNSEDLKVTNCVYNNARNFKDIISVSVLVRAPITNAGAKSNDETFGNASIVGDTSVAGYGEKATWNTATGQLNILKDKNWIIVTFGKTQPSERLLEDTKKAADSVLK